METRLTEEGFGARVPWRDGRGSMRTDSYAELVARTTTAEATNTGTLNQMTEMGQVLVKMTAHNTTCKVCAPRQGRVYRTVDVDQLPEGDPRRAFPHIREGLPRWPTYKTVHPNCAHRLLPYIWNQKTEDEQGAALKEAEKPFNLDPRGEAERLRYEKAQRENRERLRDRKEWERLKAVAPETAPRTFSGYRRQRSADLSDYQQLQTDIGRANAPRNFAQYQSLRYNGGEDWELLQAYSKSVRSGDLSALTGMDLYKSVIAEVKTELVGLTTVDGVKISGHKYHFIDRTIGSYHQKREGVSISESKRALLSPVKIRERTHPSGEISRQFRGDSCYVTINPEKGLLIQVNPR